MPDYQAGRYQCQITSQGFETLPKTSTPFFALVVKPIGKVDVNNPDGHLLPAGAEFSRTVKLWMSEKAMAWTKQCLISIGWDGERWTDLDPSVDGHLNLVGKKVELVCLHEQNGDVIWDNFQFPRGTTGTIQNDPEIAKKFDRLTGKSRKPKTEAPAVSETQDDEVPF